ncbi:type IV pilin protein [Dyella choica]|uniref:type IV pilin protein n=1 Tax=Dyella choica TaxID=1927959 RepID=UPI002E75E1BF|nr:type IV pilin protein [Dyella choica]
MSSARQAGFTLVELMIVVAVIAILAVLAWPAYQQYIIKTNRKAAESCLAEHANYMERLYTTQLTYSGATLPVLDCSSASQTGQNYAYSFAPAAASTSAYNVQAAPTSALQLKDTTCATVWIDQTGARHITGTGTLSQCW